MRISDWSSDVCSSDLLGVEDHREDDAQARHDAEPRPDVDGAVERDEHDPATGYDAGDDAAADRRDAGHHRSGEDGEALEDAERLEGDVRLQIGRAHV